MKRMISMTLVWVLLMGTLVVSAEEFINTFYAIESYSERHYTQYSDQVSIGWGEIEREDGEIVYTNQGSTYRIPSRGGERLLEEVEKEGNTLMKSVFLDDPEIFKEILDRPEVQSRLIEEIIGDRRLHPNSDVEYDGIVIDFEGLKNTMEGESGYRQAFTRFMEDLRREMSPEDKLSIAVHPTRAEGIGYFDGYDHEALGDIADQLILMSHDYHQGTKDHSQPIKASAPYDLVEESIEMALDRGVAPEKLVLGISLNPVQWREQDSGYQVFSPRYEAMLRAFEGKTPNQEIIEITPITERFDSDLQVGYTYLERKDTETGEILKDHFYYEDPRSIQAKKELAEEYDLKGVSLWRLGIGSPETMDGVYRNRMFDINNSGTIDQQDLDRLFESVGKTSEEDDWERALDYNNDGVIDAVDISRMARYVTSDQEPVVMEEKPSGSSKVTVKYPEEVNAGEDYVFSVELKNVENLFTVGIALEDNHPMFEARGEVVNFNNPLEETGQWSGTKDEGTGLYYVQSLLGNPQVLHTEETTYRIPVTAKESGVVDANHLGITVQLVDRHSEEIQLDEGTTEKAVTPITTPQRVDGGNRYETAVNIAKEAYPDGTDTVIIARGDSVDGEPQIVDALAASVLAGSVDAPILLTQTDRIPDVTKEGIRALGAETVYVMGGTAAVGDGLLEDLGVEVKRVAGNNRYETAAEVAEEASVDHREGLIVQGNALADALSVGSVAHKQGMPILLVGSSHVPQATKDQIESLGLDTLHIIGGEGVIEESVEKELQEISGVSVGRIAGNNRYETGVKVAGAFWSEDQVVLANGISMVDSVSASAFEKPILFVGNRGLNDQVRAYLQGRSKLYLAGGEAAIPGWILDESLRAME
ncbi:cell wall-binding repeat-containing protein [Isachenkonia alkalipeptolytica]|nr:cell wall-binding repeat-containing protein [Isachenkonia alkalipeptolytica]